ncbi:transposase, partial [Pseudodonghicola flavimaris]|uniref:transposase n=1 Tax=Pseudodonghicola flavimaris TaxID=3050036 RepID=UPI003899C5D5
VAPLRDLRDGVSLEIVAELGAAHHGLLASKLAMKASTIHGAIQTKGGMNSKLHAICDSQGRPLSLFVTAGQVSDDIGAWALLSSLPNVEWLLGDRGYDADWFREALNDKGIHACIPGRKQRKKTVKYDKRRYKRRNRTENMFGRLKGSVLKTVYLAWPMRFQILKHRSAR